MSFQDLSIRKEYRSLLDDVVNNFYLPILDNSVLYKRAVGFFSSSALVEVSKGISGLIRNGGKIQLIASPRLSPEDIEAIKNGFERRYQILEECLIRNLKEPQGPYEDERLNLLSNLIATGVLDIKIAFLEANNQIGMYHEKLGLMYDDIGNIIAFTGSMNESAHAFSFNYEAIDVFTSWTEENSRVYTKESAFNSLWNDYEPKIKVLEFPRISDEILARYKKNNIVDLSIDERELGAPDVIDLVDNCPKVPSDISIRPYQDEAIESWENHNFQGIFDMATGTGKTYTALAAVSGLFTRLDGRLAVIIVCPFQHLVEQWKEDIEKFNMKPIVCYSASAQRDWKSRLKTAVTSFSLGVLDHFCMVTTNATFSSDYVQNQMQRLTDNAVLIVDEAHNFGAEKLQQTLLANIPFRLALSATIDRFGDEEGTKKLYEYFGEKCIEYTLEKAINSGMLTPYYYYPVPVSLTENELSEYLELTQKISASIFHDNKKHNDLSEYVKMLLIKRARIVAGAQEKIGALSELMSNYKNDTHMLVYCGATTMRDVDYRENRAPIEEMRQIDIIADLLGNEHGMRVSKYSSAESAKEREILKTNFAEGKLLQALIAIRCLDEGVNIPSIKTAFILASSTNPKEYIQRRGRVLRNYTGKRHASIFDFITLPVPLDSINSYSDDVLNSVKSLAKKEIKRMQDFASISENPSDVEALVADIVFAYDIILEDGEEESIYA